MNSIVRNGILIAMALVLSLAEKWFPLSLLVPLPGVKLGLANVVSMFALFFCGWQSALVITVLRCLLASIFYGGIISLALSLSGGLLALVAMTGLKIGYDRWISIVGISIGGAAAHNIGQVAMAALLLNSQAVIYYLAVLLITAVVTGILTGTLAQFLFSKLQRIGFLKGNLV